MSTGPVAQFSGLASGIQWKDTVDMLIQIESIPMNRLQARKAEEQSKIDAWTSIQSKLTALQSAAQKIDTSSELLAMNATSADSDVFTVSANSDAVPSIHEVTVNQLARQEVFVHDTGWADLNSTSLTGSGTEFVYEYDGVQSTVTLASGATLRDLIDAINSDENNPGVTASSLNDGGTTDPYHLVLTATEAASTDSIAVDDAGTTIGSGSFDTANWTRTVNAQEAQIRVDGYPAGSWISSSSNTVEDVIEGVTLNLKDTSGGNTVTVTVTQDNTETKESINEWVTAYNALITELEARIRFNEVTEKRGLLASDTNLRTLRSDMIDIVANEIEGVADNALYRTLGSVGIDFTAGGKLKVDAAELLEALEDDAQEVAKLFTLSNDSGSPYVSFFKQESETEGGEYEVTVTYKADGTIDSTASNTIGGYAAKVESGQILVGAEGTPVEGLRLYLDPPSGTGTINTTFRLSKGVASKFDSMVDLATDSIDGLVKQAKDIYEDSIESLDRQIEAFQRRLKLRKNMLTRQFLAMEEAVSEAQSQANWTAGL